MTNKEECLYDWLFHFNHYTGLWAAFKREDSNMYFSDAESPNLKVHKSTDIKTLITILTKFNCNSEDIDKL